jgi:amino acid transporter
LIFKVEKESRMLATITLGAFAALSAVLSVAAASVVLRRSSTKAQREFAWKLFRASWVSGTVTATAGLVRIHQSGLLDWTAILPP